MAGLTAIDNRIDPALVARFRAALGRLNPDGGWIGLAVSGGPDSMAMLLLAQAAIPGRYQVATVDHGLRPEAKDECALVMAACAARGVPGEVLTVTVGAGNVQAEARKARYDALGAWAEGRKLVAVATAHHADDQAETLLMRLNRGSGLAGLAGVRAASRIGGLRVIRPLLELRRAELAAICASTGTAFVSDPSNDDTAFDRVRMRQLLAATDAFDAIALARSARHLADADEAVEAQVDQVMASHVASFADHVECFPLGDREVALRVLRRVFALFGAQPRGAELARLLDGLLAGEASNLAGVRVSPGNDQWHFSPEPPRRSG